MGYSQWEVAAIAAAVRGEGEEAELLEIARSPQLRKGHEVLKRYYERVRQATNRGQLVYEINQFSCREFEEAGVRQWAQYYAKAIRGQPRERRKSKTAVVKGDGNVTDLAEARKRMAREHKELNRQAFRRRKEREAQ